MLSEFLKRLIFARQFDMVDGNIDILGVKQLMFPVDVIKNLNLIDRTKTYDAVKRSVKKDTERFSKKLGSDKSGILKNIVNLFDTYGLGDMSIIDLNTENKTAMLRIDDKSFHDNFNAENKICDTFTAGVLAGIFSFVFDDDINAKEIECQAFGYEYCKFIIKGNIQ